MNLAPIGRRLISLIYEALLLTGLLFCAAFVYYAVEQRVAGGHTRAVFQLYLASVAGLYFVWQWTRGGRTLPMKTWRLRLVTADGTAVQTRQALVRYVAALAGAIAFGAGFTWAFFDRDRQFLHDRIAGTRIVRE
ncbi:MAG TPA: RDD family protein [Burkholderiales bacterium]|nr:RDD family protein [Burkholderiales bacterium]